MAYIFSLGAHDNVAATKHFEVGLDAHIRFVQMPQYMSKFTHISENVVNVGSIGLVRLHDVKVPKIHCIRDE